MNVTSWRTTVSGLVVALAGFVMFSPEHFQQWPVVVSLAKYVMLGGFMSLGIACKDASVHSTQAEVRQATVDQQVAVAAKQAAEARQ